MRCFVSAFASALALAAAAAAAGCPSGATPCAAAWAPQKTLALAAPSGYKAGDNVPRRNSPSNSKNGVGIDAGSATCKVIPHGWGRDDAPQIMAAAQKCGHGGTIELPAPYVYSINSRMDMQLVRARLHVHGTLAFSPDLDYWIQNSHRIEFQNQSAAWTLHGHDFVVDGGGWRQGGIDGSGQAWYSWAQGQSNLYGRPMPMVIHDSYNVTVRNFSFRQVQFWTLYLQDCDDVLLEHIYINGTNTDPRARVNGSNYEINVDGLDTLRVNRLTARHWAFHGGDDCVSPKGNSTNMHFHNFTCEGGGIAFGSVGQYADAPDYIANVSVSDVYVGAPSQSKPAAGAYFKSWVGVAAGKPPQGGGGGRGHVSNVTVSNLRVNGTKYAAFVNKCYFKVPSQAAFCDTSELTFEGLSFHNVSGTVTSDDHGAAVSLNCSAAAPCRDIRLSDVHVHAGGRGGKEGKNSKNSQESRVSCVNVVGLTGAECAQ
ncbi:unnamed protein product [Parajaminaea phylloscopi]